MRHCHADSKTLEAETSTDIETWTEGLKSPPLWPHILGDQRSTTPSALLIK